MLDKIAKVICYSKPQMWPFILQLIRSNIRYVALPFAAVIGFVGFNAESWLRSPEEISSSIHNPKQTISEARTQRQLVNDLNTFKNAVHLLLIVNFDIIATLFSIRINEYSWLNLVEKNFQLFTMFYFRPNPMINICT
ncbi:unnamed protein product [Heterobilharzia americana]|nr:unnamed protein product [Heterobilharzia americana]